MSSGYKPITVREDVHDSLVRMKDKTNRSFSDVIKALTNEKDKIIDENNMLREEIKKLIDENNMLREEKGKGFLGLKLKR